MSSEKWFGQWPTSMCSLHSVASMSNAWVVVGGCVRNKYIFRSTLMSTMHTLFLANFKNVILRILLLDQLTLNLGTMLEYAIRFSCCIFIRAILIIISLFSEFFSVLFLVLILINLLFRIIRSCLLINQLYRILDCVMCTWFIISYYGMTFKIVAIFEFNFHVTEAVTLIASHCNDKLFQIISSS